MTAWSLTLRLLPDRLAICRLPAEAVYPPWTAGDGFSSLTRTADELSVVCATTRVPAMITAERDWRCLKVEGPFALDGTIGVLAALTVPLAANGISLFTISTFDTDYLLVKDRALEGAVAALRQAGHHVVPCE